MSQDSAPRKLVTSGEVEDALRECLVQVMGADVVSLMDITEDTLVFKDLGLSSLDLLKIAETINERYPIAQQLTGWAMTKSLPEIGRLTVGDIVTFIVDTVNADDFDPTGGQALTDGESPAGDTASDSGDAND
ncbi:MAG: phosphopantetheine-binding protein [Actinomycetia bacterium]|nr:phosphopantetheine-binding protein [Actinomycetes bacterium]